MRGVAGGAGEATDDGEMFEKDEPDAWLAWDDDALRCGLGFGVKPLQSAQGFALSIRLKNIGNSGLPKRDWDTSGATESYVRMTMSNISKSSSPCCAANSSGDCRAHAGLYRTIVCDTRRI